MKQAEEVELPIGGMTCAAWALAVEGQLSSSDGVDRASVNFAPRTARVLFDPSRTRIENLLAAVDEIGYEVPQQPLEVAEAAEARDLRRRLIVGLACAAP